MGDSDKKLKLATVWLGGCSGCHMSFLDLDEKLIELFDHAELVYSPIADVKAFPLGVDVALVEGAVANEDNLELARQVRERSSVVVSFGDCAVTGNVTSLRNRLGVPDLLTAVYREGPGRMMEEMDANAVASMPVLLPKVLPLHHVVEVDAFVPGCPPEPDEIWAAVSALLSGKSPETESRHVKFG